LEYDCWEWILEDGSSIQHDEVKDINDDSGPARPPTNRTLPSLGDYQFDFASEKHSERNTRGIFGWLRSTGYPLDERPIYQHQWLNVGNQERTGLGSGLGSGLGLGSGSGRSESSESETEQKTQKQQVEKWLTGLILHERG
jgi:hypothetical protein